MDYSSLDDFLARSAAALAKGPVAMVFAEDPVELDTSVRHHLQAGFAEVLLFLPPQLSRSEALPDDLADRIHCVPWQIGRDDALTRTVNPIIDAAADTTWIYYCYNAEYLFHPFCESRTIREMIAFHTEERRDAALAYVIDLYAGDLGRYPNAVSLEEAMMDGSGYYALARADPQGHPRERQLDFFGGLRWRFEEHIPKTRRKIDRIALFRAQKGLRLQPDHTFNIQEYNTYACPWHHNITLAIASFRTAKALKSNPGSTFDIASFTWHNTVPFEWHSQQLMDLGLMEPGQWF